MDVSTPSGLARLTWHPTCTTEKVAGLLLLGHGAGGGITAPDLLLTADLAVGLGMAVGLVEQPYRLLSRRPPPPAAKLDPAFVAVVAAARREIGGEPPLVIGGRSSGARVACRTARQVHAAAVIALAFPLRPPRPPGKPRPTRLLELADSGVPVLVIQGDRDPFGSAEDVRRDLDELPSVPGVAAADVTVSGAAGADHSLRKGIDTRELAHFLARFLT